MLSTVLISLNPQSSEGNFHLPLLQKRKTIFLRPPSWRVAGPMSDGLFEFEHLTNTNLLAVLRRSIPDDPCLLAFSQSAVSVAFNLV